MKEKINIAEILKDKPKGIRLYSPIFGDCSFQCIQNETDDICVKKHNNGMEIFSSKGLYNILGECLLFPSRNMRDWSKFLWKRGDVLVSNDGDSHIIFKGFSTEDYSMFKGKHWISVRKKRYIPCLNVQNVQDYHIEDDEDAAQTYINTIEKQLGGKLNRETLEIEKAQPEFKDEDIVVYGKSVAICRKIYKHTLSFYVSLNEMFGLLFDDEVESSEEYRFATEEEKQQLFDALEKEGKAWDAEKKQIVDLKSKIDELKPYDKVLVKDNPYGSWEPALFWKKVDVKDFHPYMIIGGKRYRYCEPYEGSEHLLGTTNNV
jgi:hypothetical protein